ncbi:hypothetical protein R5W60_05330 [Brucella pseudintermedia]|uniref:hypothetical protein n=1 Tax=Brucella pseudintermedia TaxID=370111 RepID=UPI00366D3A01|nr:hypothetical protein R5W60_04005 [Brucella pseudintermedia]WPM81119.1 hypothetical protein R5W60_05330 [Brucella pseudintermedia]
MMNMTSDLITRLSKLDAPDREVDAEIDVLFFGGETVWKQANYTMEQFPASKRSSKHHICGYAYECVLAYTASVDAAIALAERVLPGWTWTLWPNAAEIRHPTLRMIDEVGSGSNPAIALCIAILRAKEASKP